MTAAVKTVLFVDYDSLYLSLRARDAGMARRFASRPGAWIEAIESGLLIAPSGGTPTQRRILMRRCYADPKLLGKARAAFSAQGFQIVDCPPLPGRERNSAEIQMVLDTVDALGHQTGFEEFILLSADSDLTPVIFRLRSYNRATTIYSTAMTSAGYRAIADGAIEEAALMAVLAPTADAEAPEADEPDDEPGAVRAPGDRDDLASLARRVHQATNVPLFSPKVYAELFRALAHEIAENGYHFQATAENVAARLVAAGRNASRRQIAFVVKGLALKGHVFSVTDSPERLAEVFKEQVLYLARNAGMELDDGIELQVQGWIVGRAGSSDTQLTQIPALPPPTPSAAPAPAPPASTARLTPIPSPPPMPESADSAQRPRPISLRATGSAMPQPIRPITVRPAPARQPMDAAPAPERGPPERPAPERAPPPPPERPRIERAPIERPILERRSQAPVAAPAEPPIVLPSVPITPPAPPQPAPAAELPPEPVEPIRPRSIISPPRPRAPRPPAEPAPAEAAAPAPVSPPRPPASRPSGVASIRPPARRVAPAPASEAPKDDEKDPIESSILAAIAEAVDVLVVEDGTSNPPATAQPSPQPASPQARSAPAAEPQPDDADIGDEIQRILAAYSQSRKPGTK